MLSMCLFLMVVPLDTCLIQPYLVDGYIQDVLGTDDHAIRSHLDPHPLLRIKRHLLLLFPFFRDAMLFCRTLLSSGRCCKRSSAKSRASDFVYLWQIMMKASNNIWPGTVPCGNPDMLSAVDNAWSSWTTRCCLLPRKSLNHLRVISQLVQKSLVDDFVKCFRETMLMGCRDLNIWCWLAENNFFGCKSYVQDIEVLVRDRRPGVFVFKRYKTYVKSFVIYVNNEIMQIMLLNCKLHVP